MNSTQSKNALAALLRDGMEHHRAGRLAEAEGAYRRALAIDPGHPEALAVTGILMGQGGNLPAAAELLARALKRDPRNPQIHHNLGETWRHLGETAKAEASLRRAIELNPDHYDAYQSLADLSLAEAARQEKAGRGRRAQELRLIAASLLVAVGQRMVIKDFRTAAVEKYRAAAALDPDNPVVWRGLGNALVQLPSEAEPALRRAIALDPENPWAYAALGDVLMALDRPAEAEAVYRQGLARAPGDMACRQGLVWVTLAAPLYRPETGPDRIFAAHRAWGREAMARAGNGTARPFANARDPEKRLKLGYVSPDFKRHSVAYFFEPLLWAHDKAGFETFCYAEVPPHEEDEVTSRLRKLARHWRPTVGLSDEALRKQVRRDGIDILIDLAGHFGRNRLDAFAVKPAPVTATWLGYPATSGLPTIDWRITDAVADPPGAERFHTEKLMRLENGFLCFRPFEDAPESGPPPALAEGPEKGRITFGSFNNHAKLNPAVAGTWASLLRAVPASRLSLKFALSKDMTVREKLLRLLTAQGIDAARVDIEAWRSGMENHYAAYNRIDIALDPFPYNGTTTTCEALWMGVPVVTLVGDRHAGRVGLDLLTRVGLERFAAADPDSYVRIAADLAGDLDALGRLRAGLRGRMRNSVLCDAPCFAREFEACLRLMWREWCAGGGSA